MIKNEAVVAGVVIDGLNPNQIRTDFSVRCYACRETDGLISHRVPSRTCTNPTPEPGTPPPHSCTCGVLQLGEPRRLIVDVFEVDPDFL